MEVYPDSDALAAAAAAQFDEWFAQPGHTTVGLAGGSTPRRTYDLLRTADIDWQKITGWMTDERHVPIEHLDSNAGMARVSLFDHVPARIRPVPYSPDAQRSADHYSEILDGLLGTESIGLVLLGIGDDGHTASLFPGTEAIAVGSDGYIANWVPQQRTWRLTATFGMLARAERTIFLVAGESKAAVVQEILAGGSQLPAAIVSEMADEPVWLLDAAAASAL